MLRLSVSQELVKKVGRMTDGSLKTVFNELIQNARRAGAKRCIVSYDAKTRTYTISDDGSGIEDIRSLLTLGKSGWSEVINDAEDPGGMGGISVLYGRPTTIRSWDWRLRIPSKGWDDDLSPGFKSGLKHAVGTTIRFQIQKAVKPLDSFDLISAFQYTGVTLVFGGQEYPPKSFLEDRDFVTLVPNLGIAIGLGDKKPYNNVKINFYGITVETDSISCLGVFKKTPRVDMRGKTPIRLVLPERKRVVQNAAYRRLETACFDYCIQQCCEGRLTHTMQFEQFQEVRARHPKFPESIPMLVDPDDAFDYAPLDSSSVVCKSGDGAYYKYLHQIVDRDGKLGIPSPCEITYGYEKYEWARKMTRFLDPTVEHGEPVMTYRINCTKVVVVKDLSVILNISDGRTISLKPPIYTLDGDILVDVVGLNTLSGYNFLELTGGWGDSDQKSESESDSVDEEITTLSLLLGNRYEPLRRGLVSAVGQGLYEASLRNEKRTRDEESRQWNSMEISANGNLLIVWSDGEKQMIRNPKQD